MRDIKKKSKQKIEDTLRAEEESEREDTARSDLPTAEVAEDGTLPMPEGEEELPTLPTMDEDDQETTGIKKLKKKKEETVESESKYTQVSH